MNAVEFQTIVANGSIEIPPELQGQIRGSVRVIVLTEETHNKNRADLNDAIARLLANPIRLAAFMPLTREQIYDRS